MNAHLHNARHIELRSLSREAVTLISRKSRHFVRDRDTLSLGGDYVVVLGGAVKESAGTRRGELRITEDHKARNLQTVIERTDRQISLTARNCHVIIFLFHMQSPQSSDRM